MKEKKKLFAKTAGVFALAALVFAAFAMAACSSDGGGDGPPPALGETLTLTGQIYTAVDADDEEFTPPEYTKMTATSDAFTITTNPGEIGGEGTITEGMLNFTAATPTTADLVPISNLTEEGGELDVYDDVVVTPAEANFAMLKSLGVTIDGTYYDISKEKQSGNVNLTTYSGNIKEENVYYVYVDQDVTITAKGKETTDGVPGMFSMTMKTGNVTLKLAKGWNAIYGSGSGNMTASETAGIVITMNMSISVSNPDLQWSAWTYEY